MPPKLTNEQKALRGTLRHDRQAPPPSTTRTAADVKSDVEATQQAIASMQEAIRQATQAITQGTTSPTAITNSNGQVTVTERINPGFKALRESMAALKTFRAYLVILQSELSVASELENKSSGSNIDKLIAATRRKHGLRD
jgi:hypothetical protein